MRLEAQRGTAVNAQTWVPQEEHCDCLNDYGSLLGSVNSVLVAAVGGLRHSEELLELEEHPLQAAA